MLKEHELVMLLTNEKANNKYSPNELLLCINTETKNVLKFGNNSPFDILGGYFKPQHLYILSDEEIKEGDWYYQHNPYGSVIDKCDSKSRFVAKSARYIWENGGKKIIATTNKFLSLKEQKHIIQVPLYERFPQIPQPFIEYFVEEYNKGNLIIRVMVEYEEVKYNSSGVPVTWSSESNLQTVERLKINPDNTINIKPFMGKSGVIKNSYSREEVIELCNKAANLMVAKVGKFTLPEWWINENL